MLSHPCPSYIYLAGAIANVVLIRWSDYIGRKRVLIGVLVLMCIGTLFCIFGTTLPVVVAGRVLQGTSNVTFGLAFLIMRERLTPRCSAHAAVFFRRLTAEWPVPMRCSAVTWWTTSDIGPSSS